MLRYSFLIFLFFHFGALAQDDVLKYVNPLTGTANSTTKSAIKHGEGTEALANVIPAVGVPFGMTQWTPQTRLTEKKCIAPYYYKDPKISGLRATHWLSGSCTQDYGSFTVMPISGQLKTSAVDYASSYAHEDEVASPDYYKVLLRDYLITAEVTGLERSAMLKFTAGKTDDFYLLMTPNSDKDKGFIKIDRKKGEVSGYNPAYRIYQGLGQPAGFSGYFVIQFDRPFSKSGTFSGNQQYGLDSLINQKDLGAYLKFEMEKGEILRARVGTSFTSIANARKNLATEITGWNFDEVRKRSAAAWNKALNQIQVKTDLEKQKNIFYTAFYHSLQHPRLFTDVDGTYPKFAHQYENAVLKGTEYYDDFSMWDIYRAQLPLLEILQPQKIGAFVNSMVLKGEQGGWLPIFPCWNSYTNAMIGDHGTAFIASAYTKGIRGFDTQKAYQLMRKNAFEIPDKETYRDGKGRRALDSYLKYDYIPLEDSVPDAFHKREQVSRTLEYAFNDYALAIVARDMGKTEDMNLLLKRSSNYKNVFQKEIGSVNGRYADGSWATDFKADVKLPFITEGTPRQYMFYVPHDVSGLASTMGGKKTFEKALDSLFIKGEYWHGNEPGHQIPFLYNFTDSPWKTQREVRKILSEEYDDGIGGLSGNDDAGQMSAWYLFAAMGFYPVNPVANEYLLSTPLFQSININLQNGKTFTVQASADPLEMPYITSVKLNGKSYRKNYLSHQDIMNGGTLEIKLGKTPNEKWGAKDNNQPSGISNKAKK
ncbi:glycoside hydrolase family 92 protein [Pedobacter frigiditerrae]|uniref:Glycoside hydrolase family 92 protein n=1 Tax=Pedobacter frigiditerrae TaxID=2530452 RepID=A0A4R0MQR2_9SPHI|nr:GH92 family glycosyl hydrolase [Pedobacter frigiditerrae]TCC88612.1 glycoside hydrolase family 92 protein [Pedobacter frigiditerrae]